ncbi:M16 family metallopeptidase [Flavobacterium sp.]|uniref:M16 family metallopeptidase n=1 Tax=Flavobacterium sp. TaxID=239 RepID=UPI003529004D
MKKILYIAASLFFMGTTQAQERPMPVAGPAPKININKPQTFTLKNGLKVLIVENHKLPRVSFTLTLDNTPYAEGNKKGESSLVSAMLGNGTESMSKEKFNEEVDFLGASINFWSEGASASGLSRYSDRILELMADGALHPVFSQEDFDKEKAKMIEGLKTQEKSASTIARRVENVLTYGKDHYNGEFVSEETLNNVTLADVKANYTRYFVPGDAYLVIIGDINAGEIEKKVKKLFGKWSKGSAPSLSYTDPKDVGFSQINFVDVPNAVQSEVSVVNLSHLKMTDKDYFATILANQILGGGGEGRLFLNLREAHGWTYGSYSSIGADKYIGKFRSSASVRNAVTDSAIVEIFNELKRIRTELVSDEDLKNAKAKYIGNFVMQIEKPETIARYALNIETQNLSDNFYENFMKNINAVTAEDIRNAAQKYFSVDNARVVVIGKASDVLPGLQKLSQDKNLPIFYYDKYGNLTDKPEIKKVIPAGVTSTSVLENYLTAIGGKEKAAQVKTIYSTASATVQGTPLELVQKFSKENMLVEMKAMGMTMMKQVVTSKGAYIESQGQKNNIEGNDLKQMQNMATTFVELNLLNNSNVKLQGIETINDKDAYVLVLDETKYYYDATSGLKVAEAITTEQMGQKMTRTTYYDVYTDVNGLQFPYKTTINMGMEIELTTTDVKINEGVTDADFE